MASKAKSTWNTFGVLDSDEEDGCCGGCGAAALATKKKGVVDMDWLENEIIRHRYWPYPSEEEESNPSAWPCPTCGPVASDEGAFWECKHGKWLWVESWAAVPALPEDHSLEECRGGSCPGHGLMTGDILALYIGPQAGLMWGDILALEHEAELAAETPAQKAARLAEEARKDAERAAAVAAAEIRKAKELVASRPSPPNRRYDRRTGKPMPCKFFCFQGVLGKEHPAERDPRTGTMWESGCAFHKKGKCEFFHPDEPEWQVILGKVESVAPSSRPTTPPVRSSEPEWRTVGQTGPIGAGGGGFTVRGGGNSSRSSGGGGGFGPSKSGKGRW